MGNKVVLSSRVDEQVLFTFLGVGLLAIIILGFRYTTRSSCMPINIQISGDTIQGTTIRFNAQTTEGKSFSWDFGDGKPIEEQTASTTHTFNEPGLHTVSVLVNGTCTESRDIFVRRRETPFLNNLRPKIVALDKAIVGQEIQFSDANSSAYSWDWNFDEPGAAGSHDPTPVFTFTTPGTKRVVLRVNGKIELTDTKLIYVSEKEKNIDNAKPKPDIARRPPHQDYQKDPVTPPLPQPQPEVPVKKEPDPPPAITKIAEPSEGYKAYVEGVLKKVPDGADWKEALSKYLCGSDLNTAVWYDNKQTTLNEFCGELKKMKTKKIKQINVVPSVSKQTNCITELKITIDKKNFFQRVL